MKNFLENNSVQEKREDELDPDLIQKTKEQLEIIKESLRDFVGRIIIEQPDVVVFMDKGARIFGTPIKEYLKILGLPKVPEIRYYNDDDLKLAYVNNLNIQKMVDEDLADLKDKKVFFLDETYFSGKGAAALKKAKNILNNENISYFALTVCPNEQARKEEVDEWQDHHALPLEEHQKIIEEIKKDKNFVVYENEAMQLFSRLAAKYYVEQIKVNERTTTVHFGSKKMMRLKEEEYIKTGQREISFPSAFETPEEEMEYRKKSLELIARIKKMILETLKEGNK